MLAGSSEVEYDGSAVGWLLGSPGRGVAAIMDMVSTIAAVSAINIYNYKHTSTFKLSQPSWPRSYAHAVEYSINNS